MTESKLPLMIGIGSRVRKSPYYESTLKYGVTGFTVYNKMYLPTGYSDPSKEYESLINDYDDLSKKLSEIQNQEKNEIKKQEQFSEKIDELNQETDNLLDEIDKWQT